MQSTAVLLLQMGGPDSLVAVKPFLTNLFADREIIQIGPGWLQPLIARFIVSRRAPLVVEKYREIGGGSPIQKLTQDQADALAYQLGLPCYVGMRYWHPFTSEALSSIRDSNITRIIALSLYPHYSRATSGSSFNDLKRQLTGVYETMKLETITSFYDHPLYIQALSEQIRIALATIAQDTLHFLFSAHSLPQSFIDDGDPYLDHVCKSMTLVMDGFPGVSHSLAFQSRSGPVKWLGPSTDDELKRLAKSGCKHLLIIPLSFVSDHIETLHEIDIEYVHEAKKLGIQTVKRTESLNCSPTFISCLADLVRNKL